MTETQDKPTGKTWSDDLPETEIAQIKTWRRDLEEISQAVLQSPPCRERALAITRIQEATMWLGMDLKRLAGGVSCYPEGYNPDSPVVEPCPPEAQPDPPDN